ncbi:hypothetical protein PSPO01_13209 [Paraphaeosphaeria sporulosa]
MDQSRTPTSSTTDSRLQNHVGLPEKEKRVLVYNKQRNETKIVRKDTISDANPQKIVIPKGSRFVDVQATSYDTSSFGTSRWANVNIASVEIPRRIRLERKLTKNKNYQHLFVI